MPYGAQQVVNGDEMTLSIWTMVSQPHVEDMFYFGGYGSSSCPGCTAPGIFSLQRRYRPQSNAYQWSWARLAFDDLEVPVVLDLDWGPVGGDPHGPARDLYVTTSGGGWVDGLVEW